MNGSSIAPSINRIFGHTAAVSPIDVTYTSYNDAGVFTAGGQSPYHGDYAAGSSIWMFPDDSKVVDSTGMVYSTAGLIWLNSLGTSINDMDFVGSNIP